MMYNKTRYSPTLVINIITVICISIFSHDIAIAQDSSSKIIPKTYTAIYVEDSMTIDGLPNEEQWRKAEFSDDFIDIEGVKKPKYHTKFKMLWSKTHIYFYAQMEEPHVWGNLRQRDTIIYHNNDFEIFIDPDGDSHSYYEFEFNALNTLWDLFLTKPYREETIVLNDWDAKGLQSAVHVEGTLNNPKDIDKKWSLEIAIPLRAFKVSYFEKADLASTFWRVNFSRVHWDFELENGRYSRKKNAEGQVTSEYNWVWSPQGVIAMHQPETWGYVYFSPKQSNFSPFIIPKEEQIKWKLFELYRAQKNYYKKHKKWSNSIEVLHVNTSIENKTLEPVLENHSTGWNIYIKSPFSNQIFTIREDGKLISKQKK